jgi:hypothetical protein
MFLTMLAYNSLACLALLLLVAKNPRFMMQDYPPEITAGIPPQILSEKRAAMIYGFPFLAILAGFPLVFGLINKFSNNVGFIENLLSVFMLMFSFNLVDLAILDWILFCWITPDFMVLPGTEGNPGYKNYRFHFIGFLKGTLIVGMAALVLSGLIEGIFFLSIYFS